MENNSYECPRCHNIFPEKNKFLHDIRCTNENPMPLDQSRILEQNKKEPEKKIIEEKKEEIKPPQDQIRKPPSGEFPEVFECNICHQVLMEKERKDHMYCHNLETEDKNRQNEFRVSEEEIKRQKLIEKQIERNNRMNQDNNNDINNERKISIEKNEEIKGENNIARSENDNSPINTKIIKDKSNEENNFFDGEEEKERIDTEEFLENNLEKSQNENFYKSSL